MNPSNFDDLLKQIVGQRVPTIHTCKFCGEEYEPIRTNQLYCTLTCEFMGFELKNGIGCIPEEAYRQAEVIDTIAINDFKNKRKNNGQSNA